MTRLTRLRHLVRRVLKSNLAGMLASWLFIFPVPIAIYFGFACLEDLRIIPESIAICFVCLVPMWTGVVLLTAFWLIDVWAKRT